MIKVLLIGLLFTVMISCANYDDGYAGAEKKSYILFGKKEYENGYLDGEDDSWCDYLEETNRWQEHKEQCL